MDDPAIDREDLSQSLGFIRKVNRRLGGEKALVGRLGAWSAGWAAGETVTLLDVGTGSADLPVAAVKWARGREFDLRVTAVDNHPTTLDLAREHVEGAGAADAIALKECDALRLMDDYEPASFDYVHAGMFLHHLSDLQVLTMLRIMERLARRGIIWNDLLRTRFSLMGIKLLTIGQPEVVKHDAIVSVKAGFSRREVRDIAARMSFSWCRVRTSVLTGRFTVAGEKPGLGHD